MMIEWAEEVLVMMNRSGWIEVDRLKRYLESKVVRTCYEIGCLEVKVMWLSKMTPSVISHRS